MKNFIDKYFFIAILLIIFVIIIVSYLYGMNSLKSTIKNSKFTVANITSNWHQKNNTGVGTDFIYKVKDNNISKTCDCNLKKGTKYLVMYDSLKPSNYIMLEHHQLPNNIFAPYNGWSFKEIPIKIDSTDLKKYFDKLGVK